MSTVQPNYLFLNSPAGADVTLSNKILTLGQSPNSISLNVQKVGSLVKVESEAAAARVQTATVALPAGGNVAGLNYSLQVTQLMGSEYRTVYASYETVGTETAIQIATSLVSVLSALISAGSIELASATNVGGTSAVITITSSTTNPVFLAEVLEGNITLAAASPVGTEAFGQGADLIAAGITGISAQPVSGTSYDALFIEYGIAVQPENTINRDQAASLVVYYNEAAGAGLTAFLAALNAAIANATANAELINLSDTIA